MLNMPPPTITILQNQVYNITCSAYGNPEEMTGTVMSPNNPQMTFKVIREENSFVMKATVEKSGTYICTIKSKANQVQSFSTINVFSCKLTLVIRFVIWLTFGIYKRKIISLSCYSILLC